METEIQEICKEIQRGRLNDETLQMIELIMTCKDVKSLMELRSSLREYIRLESLSVLREIKEKSVEHKLLILEFFVRAFALIGDMESCLALKYEAFLLREIKSTSGGQLLQVSYVEWLNFAEQLIQNGFHSIARQACEKANSCLQKDDSSSAKASQFSGDKNMQRLKDSAVKFSGPCSVQAQAAEYLKRKLVEKRKHCSSFDNEAQIAASVLFRDGIKKRNVRQFQESQRGKQKIKLLSND